MSCDPLYAVIAITAVLPLAIEPGFPLKNAHCELKVNAVLEPEVFFKINVTDLAVAVGVPLPVGILVGFANTTDE